MGMTAEASGAGSGPDIAAGRLDGRQLTGNFADIHPPLDRRTSLIEASRCYFCYDAPCVEACPTGIDIPAFIKSIHTENVKGAARTILDSNIMGGTCSRVCPVEELCEEACVRNTQEDKPVTIGALQRFATDRLFESGAHCINARRRPAIPWPWWVPGRPVWPVRIACRCSAMM